MPAVPKLVKCIHANIEDIIKLNGTSAVQHYLSYLCRETAGESNLGSPDFSLFCSYALALFLAAELEKIGFIYLPS